MDCQQLHTKSNTSCVVHTLIKSLVRHVSLLNPHVNNFVSYYNSCPIYNFHHRQHITSHVFTNKRLSIKLLYIIHRIFRKIILVTIGEKLHVNDAGQPFYVFGSPVAKCEVVDILHKFKLSINRCAPVCSLLLQKVFLIDHFDFLLEYFSVPDQVTGHCLVLHTYNLFTVVQMDT